MSLGWKRKALDAYDVLCHVRNPIELIKVLVPRGRLKPMILNQGEYSEEKKYSPSEVSEALRKLKNRMKAELISDDGRVRYDQLLQTKSYQLLLETSQLLRSVDPAAIEGDAAKIAFWLNLYNVLSIHGVGVTGVRHSVMEIPSFFHTIAYQVGKWTFTLDEIENGVLRRNEIPLGARKPNWEPDDPRLAASPSMIDSRIHMALVCASSSCPPVAFYTADGLEAQLEMAVANYIAADVSIDAEKRCVWVPIIFYYYSSDFDGEEGTKAFIVKHAEERAEQYQEAFDAGYTIAYRRYDWSLNAMM